MFIAHEVAAVGFGLAFELWWPKAGAYDFWKQAGRLGLMLAGSIAGSVIPDVPFLWMIAHNRAHRLADDAASVQSLIIATDTLHTAIFWLMLLAIIRHFKTESRFYLLLDCLTTTCLSALLCHIGLDAVSHGRGQAFAGTNYFWPLPLWVASHAGVFLYRHAGEKFRLCWQEVALCPLFFAADVALMHQAVSALWDMRRKRRDSEQRNALRFTAPAN